MLKSLLKKKTAKDSIPIDLWEEKFMFIKRKWQGTPANIQTYIFPNMKQFKAEFPKSAPNKNDLFIGVIHWPANNCDIVAITKGNTCLEYPLTNRYFEDLDDTFLHTVGILPSDDNICRNCSEFATFINTEGNCHECQ